ncbi:ATP-binding cassette sub-family G member 2, partial [Dryobates pubescens]
QVGTQFTRGVSGGERKRTNIGMELITDPAILFLDEPTTGLDASTANAVLLLLKRMAQQGRTIIFSIHQPRYSIFKLFDNLTLLAAGRLLFHGPAQQALNYFQNIGYQCEEHNNPADFFLDVINGDSTAVTTAKGHGAEPESTEAQAEQGSSLAQKLAEQFCSSAYYQETKAALEKIPLGRQKQPRAVFRHITYTNSFLHQLQWVSRRTFKNLLGNPQASIAQVCVTAVLGLIVGAIFFGLKEDSTGLQNSLGFFLLPLALSCLSVCLCCSHESISGYYRTSVYFLSKLMADLIPIRTVPSILFTCITYFMLGLKPTPGAFFIMMFTLLMVSYTATALALAIATGQSVVAVANLLITVAFVFMIVKRFFLLSNLTLPWHKFRPLPLLSPPGLGSPPSLGSLPQPLGMLALCVLLCRGCTGDDYLRSQGIEVSPWGLWQNHLALACMTLILLTIAYLKLHFMKKFS